MNDWHFIKHLIESARRPENKFRRYPSKHGSGVTVTGRYHITAT